jgi:dihydrofolate synthase/folylpolyglutamate synthase
LTNVSLDHVQLLGPTVAHVAREKAGIIKASVPVVTGEVASAAATVFAETAHAVGAPIDVVTAEDVVDIRCSLEGTSFTARRTAWGDLALTTPLLGGHQAHNAALAVRALSVLPEALRPALESVREGVALTHWPGRLQAETIGGITWFFDVAHNVAGVQALTAALHALPVPKPIVAVVGVLGDKDWRNMLTPLHRLAGPVLLTTPPTAPPDRRWDPTEVLAAVPHPQAQIVPDFTAALERAHALAAAAHGSVLVTGSFHTVGDALAAFDRCHDGSDIHVPAPRLVDATAPIIRNVRA